MADEGGTARIGFVGEGYERADGFIESYPRAINSGGQIVGTSSRYDGMIDMGIEAWLLDDGNLTRLGFTGAPYQWADGREGSSVVNLNEAGQVIGHSHKYVDADTRLSVVPWLYSGGATTRLGFAGDGYERADGFEYGETVAINEVGQVVGIALRHSGGDSVGKAAWLDDGSGPVRLGFTGAGYIRSTLGSGVAFGFADSTVEAVNNQGQAIGTSLRYDGLQRTGQAAWLDDGKGPVRLGFTGEGYRSPNGIESSNALAINDAGQVIGFSESYAGIARTGRVTWVDDGTGPVRLGLTGSGYQASDSDRSDSYATDINEAGQIVGTTGRHDGSSGRGASGWFYDPVLGETTELVFSVRDDGYAFTGPAVLTEDGTVFGLYNLYDGADDLGTRLFA